MSQESERFPTINVLGDGWVAKLDDRFKKKFYYNRRTRTSTWKQPEIPVLPPDFTKTSIKPIDNGSDASKEWVKIFSNDYDRVYYFNKRTRTSVWDNPFDYGQESAKEELDESVIVLESDINAFPVARKEIPAELTDTTTGLSAREKVEELHNVKLAEAIVNLESKQQEPGVPVEGAETCEKFMVKKNLSQYKQKNSDFDKTHLWRINHDRSQDSMKNSPVNVSNVGEKLKKEYDDLYEQLKGLIAKEKEKHSDSKDMDELEAYAEDLRKRTKQISSMLNSVESKAEIPQHSQNLNEKTKTRVDSRENVENDQPKFETFAQTDQPTEEVFVEDVDESKLSKAELKKRYKMKALLRRKQEKNAAKNSSLALFIDEMEQMKEEKKAIEAEAEAKREAREKYEHLRLLKDGKGDFYKLLGIEKGATGGQVKKAYLKLMIRYHPDKKKRKKPAGEENLTQKETTERANLIKDAYQVLSDPWERFIYDEIGLEDYLMYQKVLQAFKNYIMSGVKIKKHGRKSRRVLSFYRPKQRFLWLDFAHENINTGPVRILEITNDKERKAVKGMALTAVNAVSTGMKGAVFKKTGKLRSSDKYFSIVGEERSLDIECDSKQQRDFLCARINLLRVCKQKDKESFQEHIKLYPINKKKKAAAQKQRKNAGRRKKIVKVEKSSSESSDDSSSEYNSKDDDNST